MRRGTTSAHYSTTGEREHSPGDRGLGNAGIELVELSLREFQPSQLFERPLPQPRRVLLVRTRPGHRAETGSAVLLVFPAAARDIGVDEDHDDLASDTVALAPSETTASPTRQPTGIKASMAFTVAEVGDQFGR